jgi:hypothetical protein
MMFFFRKKVSEYRTCIFKPNTPVEIVIFSKDRACQLTSLLNSCSDNLHYPLKNITVLYTASDDLFAKGYEILKNANTCVINWYSQNDFKSDLINIIDNFNENVPVMFLVDDDIFFRPLDLQKLLSHFSDIHLFASLRIDRMYKRYKVPSLGIKNENIEWNWKYLKKSLSTWHYPFSVDGNIFNSSVIKRMIKDIQFKAPNSFECAMHDYRRKKWIRGIPSAIAPPHAVLFNNPLNKVQTEGETWFQDIPAEALNKKYLEGSRIDTEKLYLCQPDAIHFAAPVYFKKNEAPGTN